MASRGILAGSLGDSGCCAGLFVWIHPGTSCGAASASTYDVLKTYLIDLPKEA